MAIYFVAAAADYLGNAPSDSNDGRDPAGFGLTGATFTNSTKVLTKTGAFTNYTHQTGDVVYISGGTGVTAGLYEIASKTDADNIVLVADIGGTNPTDVSSSSGPFATLHHAFNDGGVGVSIAAGDEVRVLNDGIYEIDNNIQVSGNGSNTDRVFIRAVDDRGVPFPNELLSTNRVHIRCAASAFTGSYMLEANAQQWTYQGLWLDGRDSGGTRRASRLLLTGSPGWGNFFVNCEFSHNDDTFANVYVNYAEQFSFCDFHDSNGLGCSHGSGNGGQYDFCRFYDNAKSGFQNAASGSDGGGLTGCWSYNNGTDSAAHHGFDITQGGTDSTSRIVNCIAYGNAGDGIYIEGELCRAQGLVWGNVLHGNGRYGLNVASTDAPETWGYGVRIDFNHYHGNTSGPAYFEGKGGAISAANINNGVVGANNTTGDPLFSNPAGGDFTISPGSPLVGTGLRGVDNGWQPRPEYTTYGPTGSWIETGLVSYPHAFFSKSGYNTFGMSTADYRVATRFRAQSSTTLEKVLFSVYDFLGNTGSPDLRIAIQDDSGGLPDGTDDAYCVMSYADISSLSKQSAWSDPLTHDGSAGGTRKSLVAGNDYWIVFSIDNFASGMVIRGPMKGHGTTGVPFGYYSTNAGTSWTQGSASASVGAALNDGTYMWGYESLSSLDTNESFSSSTTPDERGIYYVPDVTRRLVGVHSHMQFQGDINMQLVVYAADDTVLATSDFAYQNYGNDDLFELDAPVTLEGGKAYRIVWKPTTTSNNYFRRFTGAPDAEAWRCAGVDDTSKFMRTYRTDAGAWTNDNVSYYRMSLLFDAVKPVVQGSMSRAAGPRIPSFFPAGIA